MLSYRQATQEQLENTLAFVRRNPNAHAVMPGGAPTGESVVPFDVQRHCVSLAEQLIDSGPELFPIIAASVQVFREKAMSICAPKKITRVEAQ